MERKAADGIKLTDTVISRTDVARLLLELQGLIEQASQQTLRHPAGANDQKITASEELAELAKANHLELEKGEERQALQDRLLRLKQAAPVMHMSFATSAPPSFLAKLIHWLRKEVHPFVLLEVGLQPTIGAGCVVRTTNKYFDFSIGQHLRRNRQKLVDALAPARPSTPVTAAPTEVKK